MQWPCLSFVLVLFENWTVNVPNPIKVNEQLIICSGNFKSQVRVPVVDSSCYSELCSFLGAIVIVWC